MLVEERLVFMPSAGDQPLGFFPVESGVSMFSAWTSVNLGYEAQHSSGVFVLYLIQLFTGSASTAQILTYVGLFITGSIGLMFAVKQLKIIRRDIFVVPLAIAYSLNWNLFTTLQLLQVGFAAAAPYLLLYGARAVYGIGRARWNVLGLTLGLLLVTSFANVGGFGNALFILIPVVMAGVISIRTRGSVLQVLKGVVIIGLSIVLATLIGLPFFYKGYSLLLTGGFNHYVTVSSGGSLTSSPPLTRLFYLRTLMPSALSPFLVGSSPSFTEPFWPLSLSATILACICLVSRHRMRRSLAMSLMIWVLALIALINLIIADSAFVNELYGAIPLLFVLIEANNYLYTITPLWFLLAVLGVAALEEFSGSLGFMRRNGLKTFAVVLAMLTLVSSVSAFGFQPLNLSSLYQAPIDPLYPSFPSQPPQPVMDLFVALQINRTTMGPFRVLWLPYPLWFAQTFYAPGTPDVLNINSLGNPPAREAIIRALSPLFSNTTTDFGASIAPFGFKYIVVPTFFGEDNPIAFQETNDGRPVQVDGNPLLFKAFLSSQKDVVLVRTNQSYLLYQNLAIPRSSSGVMWLSNTTLTSYPGRGAAQGLGTVTIQGMSPLYSPDSYTVSVNASSPSWLIFDQTFDSGWRAEMSGNPGSLNHTLAMGWANAFLIPRIGVHSVTVHYTPQATYDKVWTFSKLITASIVAFVLASADSVRRRKPILVEETGSRSPLQAPHSSEALPQWSVPDAI